jgi:hypothetical protein
MRAAGLPGSLANLFGSCTIVELQSPNRLVLVEGDAVWSAGQLGRRPALPHLACVSPLALMAGRRSSQPLVVRGDNLEPAASNSHSSGGGGGGSSNAGCTVLVRSQGAFVHSGAPTPVPVGPMGGPHEQQRPGEASTGVVAASSWKSIPVSASGSGSSSDKSSAWCVAVDTSRLQPGLACVEVQSGRLMSNWRPVLVVNDAGVMYEINQLQPLQQLFPDRVTTFVTDLALLLQLQSAVHAAAAAAATRVQRATAAPLLPSGHHVAEASGESLDTESSYGLDDDADSQVRTWHVDGTRRECWVSYTLQHCS